MVYMVKNYNFITQFEYETVFVVFP